jgi:spermidine/putrescine transport system permease protein
MATASEARLARPTTQVEQRRRVTILLAAPGLWLLLFFVVPMAVMAVFSFRLGSFGAERQQFSLEHFQRFLADVSAQRLLRNSVVVALETSLICVALAFPIAYFLSFHAGPSRLILLTILVIPSWTSFLLRILAWKVLLGSGGIFNSLLLSLGWIEQAAPILLFSRAAVIVTLVYVWVPFVALPIFAGLERINRHLLEAAEDLGARPWRIYWEVTLPLSLPGVLAGFLSVFIPTVGEYVTPLLVGGVDGIMYGNLIQDQFARALNWPLGSVLSMVMMAVVLVLTFGLGRGVKVTDLAGV